MPASSLSKVNLERMPPELFLHHVSQGIANTVPEEVEGEHVLHLVGNHGREWKD